MKTNLVMATGQEKKKVPGFREVERNGTHGREPGVEALFLLLARGGRREIPKGSGIPHESLPEGAPDGEVAIVSASRQDGEAPLPAPAFLAPPLTRGDELFCCVSTDVFWATGSSDAGGRLIYTGSFK